MLFLSSLSKEDAIAVVERKVLAIRRLVIPSTTCDVRPRASFGIFWSDREYDLESAYRAADRALYRAKHDGGDRLVVAP